MLAKFENGNLLEVLEDKKENKWEYMVFDSDCDDIEGGCDIDGGWTHIINLELYFPMNVVDYILQFCEPSEVFGKYELLEQKTMKEYLASKKMSNCNKCNNKKIIYSNHNQHLTVFDRIRTNLYSSSYSDDKVGDAVRLSDAIRIIDKAEIDYESENVEMIEFGVTKKRRGSYERTEE